MRVRVTGVNNCEAFGVAPWDVVRLVPDPGNEADPFAIKVVRTDPFWKTPQELHVGWVSARECKGVHEVMRAAGPNIDIKVASWSTFGAVITLGLPDGLDVPSGDSHHHSSAVDYDTGACACDDDYQLE